MVVLPPGTSGTDPLPRRHLPRGHRGGQRLRQERPPHGVRGGRERDRRRHRRRRGGGGGPRRPQLRHGVPPQPRGRGDPRLRALADVPEAEGGGHRRGTGGAKTRAGAGEGLCGRGSQGGTAGLPGGDPAPPRAPEKGKGRAGPGRGPPLGPAEELVRDRDAPGGCSALQRACRERRPGAIPASQ